ncbi:hypothetical protein RHIZO_03993 [Rhizobiaceae bacterium]|nr:hypothetical protein RHIZO_03993 [Rhizobiaceae bacterium]
MSGRSDPRDTIATLDAAHAYAARGWSVIPFEARAKRPGLPWLEFQKRRASPEEVEHWFRHRRDANVGVVTGAVSGIVVVDVDAGHDGVASLATLENEHGPLPVTVESITGGGGRHLYFAHPGGSVPNRVGMLPGIDIRGDGGCVVTPPSMHASGRRYAWAKGRAPGAMAVAPLPAWLQEMLRPGSAHPGKPLAHWRELVKSEIGEGLRNTTLTSLAGHLMWHGIDPQVALELLLGWNRMRCAPPLADGEVAGIVDSVARMHARA